MVSLCSVITGCRTLSLTHYLTKFNNFSAPSIYFLYKKKKTNFERMADSAGELHNIASNSALLVKICDFMLLLLLEIIIFFVF